MSHLSVGQAKQFASESRRDPLTKQPFVAGHDVVVCAGCNSAHLRTSWSALGKCPCGSANCIDKIKPSFGVPGFSRRRAKRRSTFILMLLSAAIGNIIGCAILAQVVNVDLSNIPSWWINGGFVYFPFCFAGSFYATKLDVGVKRAATSLCVATWSWVLVLVGEEAENVDVWLPRLIFFVLLFTLPSALTAKCVGRLMK